MFSLEHATELGTGKLCPAGSVSDSRLLSAVRIWRRTVALSYRVIVPADMARWLPHGPYQVSPKIDGELWFLVLEGQLCCLISASGRVITGIPILEEAKALVLPKAVGRTVLVGELFALPASGRPYASELSALLHAGKNAAINRLGFAVFDVIMGGDSQNPHPDDAWGIRHATVARLVAGGKRVVPVRAERAGSEKEVEELFEKWVGSSRAEGLVVRVPDGRIFKIKPEIQLDMVVVGYTLNKAGDEVDSLAVALMREDKSFQWMGCVEELGDLRQTLLKELKKRHALSSWAGVTPNGVQLTLVRPELVVELRAADVHPFGVHGEIVEKMALHWDSSGWRAGKVMPSVELVSPTVERIRADKEVSTVDLRFTQLLQRCAILDAKSGAEAPVMPLSTLIRREVYTKTLKGKLAVRKLLVWKSNKEQVDADWPAYVVYLTDYSQGRAEPLERVLRPAPDEATATRLADELVADHVKKGWDRV
jgi:hypothetical protein